MGTETLAIMLARYPYVSAVELEACEKYGKFLFNTGGNPPAELLNDLEDPRHENMFSTNIVRYLLAVAVKSQVRLLLLLEQEGKLT